LSPLQSPNNLFLLPGWQPDDIESLAEKLGLLATLASSGHDDQSANVVQQIAQRSEGNPLYATFVVREVVTRAKGGEAVDIPSLIDKIPFRMGDLRRYYDYLFERIEEHQAVSVAETLALLDFGVSQSDLKEIYPAEAHRLSVALPVLSPILEQASAQGGFRIYHESFRRFVIEKLIAQEASISSRLEPVCNWLDQKGFLSDSRAYRFLLPTMRRANRYREILDRLSPRFIQDSLSNGHPSAAIALNLVVGAEVATRTQNWEILARINELQRANSTYRSERLSDLRGGPHLNARQGYCSATCATVPALYRHGANISGFRSQVRPTPSVRPRSHWRGSADGLGSAELMPPLRYCSIGLGIFPMTPPSSMARSKYSALWVVIVFRSNYWRRPFLLGSERFSSLRPCVTQSASGMKQELRLTQKHSYQLRAICQQAR
jgi:hypothetical protein